MDKQLTRREQQSKNIKIKHSKIIDFATLNVKSK